MGPLNIGLLPSLNVQAPTLFVIDTSSGKECPQTRSVGAFAGERFRSSLSYLTCGLLLRSIAARGGLALKQKCEAAMRLSLKIHVECMLNPSREKSDGKP